MLFAGPLNIDALEAPQPAAPWIGARMEIGAARTPPLDLLLIEDFERCLAWAFIERRARAH